MKTENVSVREKEQHSNNKKISREKDLFCLKETFLFCSSSIHICHNIRRFFFVLHRVAFRNTNSPLFSCILHETFEQESLIFK